MKMYLCCWHFGEKQMPQLERLWAFHQDSLPVLEARFEVELPQNLQLPCHLLHKSCRGQVLDPNPKIPDKTYISQHLAQ